MNWIASWTVRRREYGFRILLISTLASCGSCSAPLAEILITSKALRYEVLYSVSPNPADGTLDVSMHLTQSRRLLREVRFQPDDRVFDIRADGDLEVESGQVRWRPAASGGTLQWTVAVANQRNGNGYDAWLGRNWGLLRAEDIVPRASTRTLKGASSRTTLRFDLPEDWSVITPYFGKGNAFIVRNPARRFDQPGGWIVMGRLGVRRESIAGIRVAVAGPVDNSLRRMDTLAFLRWTLPELARLLPDLPSRLTIISAGEPMWRGGLSASQSLYIHADRPLISENSTSTLLHEVMHTAFDISANDSFDWIVEGLAEYYSLELLRRSGTISQRRFETALDDQADWSSSAGRLCQASSSGATTALAVTVLAAIDEEIGNKTEGAASLDDLLLQLRRRQQPIDLPGLVDAVEQLTGSPSKALSIKNLPGCRSISRGNPEN